MQEKYERLKLGLNGQVGVEEDDHLFFKACGGYNDKGRVYGLDSERPSMFERPSRARGSTLGASSYTSPMVTQLQDQLQSTQSELQTTQSELQTTKEHLCSTEEELRTTRAELEATKMQLRADLLELNALSATCYAEVCSHFPTSHPSAFLIAKFSCSNQATSSSSYHSTL